MTPPTPVLSTGYIAAGREQRAAGRSLPWWARIKSYSYSMIAWCIIHCWRQKLLPPVYIGDKPECGQAATSGEEQLPMPQSIRIADVQLSSSKAQRRAVQGLQQLALHQTACRSCSSSHDVCVQEPSHSPVRGKSIRHSEDPIDSAHMLCFLQLALSRLTNQPIPPATNQQQIQAAIMHTYTLAGPSHANRAAWWQGQYSPAPFPTPEVILQLLFTSTSGDLSPSAVFTAV